MNESWKRAVIGEVAVALYVPAGAGKNYHQQRPYHGLVLNDSIGEKDYIFSDGRVLHTRPSDLFYLPKGSTYSVKSLSHGGCYAINFDADISDEPFIISPRNSDALAKAFKIAEREWRLQTELCHVIARRTLYDVIALAYGEVHREYVPSGKRQLIEPALSIISTDFNSEDISVAGLARLCGITEAYFRRIFIGEFGIAPKEYIIGLRIGYAKRLLESGQLSVSQIARMCGYAEPCHFSREFTRYVGVSPNKYTCTNV